VGPDWYLLLQQEQQHLPEELDSWDLTGTYSCNRSSTTSLRSWTLVGPDCYPLLQQEQQHLPEELDTGGT
jgi:hypothetical protein